MIVPVAFEVPPVRVALSVRPTVPFAPIAKGPPALVVRLVWSGLTTGFSFWSSQALAEPELFVSPS